MYSSRDIGECLKQVAMRHRADRLKGGVLMGDPVQDCDVLAQRLPCIERQGRDVALRIDRHEVRS